MRTTVDINDQLLRKAKLRAAETNRTLTSILEDALRYLLNERPGGVAKRKLDMPVSGSGGLLPGVDLDDSASVLDRMDERG